MIRLAIILTTLVLLVAWDQSYALPAGELAEMQKTAENFCQNTHKETPSKPFTTDACSLFPNALGDKDWGKCCVAHDLVYWCGGTRDERREVDEMLRNCVNEKSANAGDVIYWYTRLLGNEWIPAPWRWGYGFSYFEK